VKGSATRKTYISMMPSFWRLALLRRKRSILNLDNIFTYPQPWELKGKMLPHSPHLSQRPSLLKDLNGRRDLQHAISIAKGKNFTTSVTIKHDKENNVKTMKTTRGNHSNSLPKENKH
jgi:hypothetical protein